MTTTMGKDFKRHSEAFRSSSKWRLLGKDRSNDFFITRMGGALRNELGTGTHGASLDNGRGRD